jgi:DNA-binding GntR family transcriptional regulator
MHTTRNAKVAPVRPYTPEESHQIVEVGVGSQAIKAYRALKVAILNMEMGPGRLYTETELAAKLGVSRTPVREAIQRLRHESLVTLLPRKGILVNSLSPSEVGFIYEVGEALEGMAMKLAAERASEADLEALDREVQAMEETIAAGDLDAWNTADKRFHVEVLKAAGNPTMTADVLDVYDRIERVRNFVIRLRYRPTQSTQEHRMMLEAIRRREGNRAREIAQRHWERVRGEVVGFLRDHAIPPVRLG